MIILQTFVFDKIYHLVLKDCALVHPENAQDALFKVFFFVGCFPTNPLNRTKLKYGTMKVKAYEKIAWMIEVGAIYLLGLKGSLLVYPESALSVYYRSHFLWCG